MNDNLWDEVERWKSANSLPPPNCNIGPDAEFWRYVVGQFEVVNAKLNAMHMSSVEQKVEVHSIRQDVESIKRAFPKGEDEPDYNGHHDHHESIIKASRKWGEIGTDVLKKLFGGIAWITLCFITYSIWEAFKQEVKK